MREDPIRPDNDGLEQQLPSVQTSTLQDVIGPQRFVALMSRIDQATAEGVEWFKKKKQRQIEEACQKPSGKQNSALITKLRNQITRVKRDVSFQNSHALAPLSEALVRLERTNPSAAAALEYLYPVCLPYIIEGQDVSPVHHIAHVVNFASRIALGEIQSQSHQRILVIAALLHDIGIGKAILPKITEEMIDDAPVEMKVALSKDGVKFRLEHMQLGAKIARGILEVFNQQPGLECISDDDADLILRIIGEHDYSKIPLMEDHVNARWLLKPIGYSDPTHQTKPKMLKNMLLQLHWEADALWMLCPDGIAVDMKREKKKNTVANRQGQFEYNIGLHRKAVDLYRQAYPKKMGALGFDNEGLLYRSAIGYHIACELRQLFIRLRESTRRARRGSV